MRSDYGQHEGGAWRLALAAAILVLAAPGGTAWGAPEPDAVAETLRRSVEQLRSTGEVRVAGNRILARQALPAIYEARGFSLLWSEPDNEEALLGEIAAASGEGLDPADYHFDAIRTALERRTWQPDSATAAATADLLLTDALLRLAAHFHFGKLDPATGQPRWDLVGPIRGEPAAVVATRIATGRALARQLGELRPVQPLYGRFKSALARYRVIEREGDWRPMPSGSALQVGMEDPRVVLLRRRLALTGDLRGAVLDSPQFDQALEDAVRRFQGRHGLDADGIFGPASLRALNRPLEERIDQLRANLERARWLLSEVRGHFLIVDPAGSRVVLMDNSQPVLEQGASFSAAARAVPEFRTDMRYLVVNPDWVLPTQLVESQVAPLARDRPAELAARGLQVFDRAGEPVDPRAADWTRPSDVLVRQLPGSRSFLGTLRFSMPNDQHVFLHGGPKEGRSMPGSVRLEDPMALARALAGPPAAWTRESLAAAIAAETPRTLPLGRPLPVLYAPWSVWVEIDGAVNFRSGQEPQDRAIIAGLRRGSGGG